MPGVLQLFAVVALSLLACHALHIMSSRAFHLHTCSSHASEHFPRCPFCIPALLCPPVSPFTSFRVRVLSIFGLDQDLPCILGLLPVDRLSSFVPFGHRLILQWLTEEPKRPRVCCSPTPLQSVPKTHLNLLHHLGRSITIAWPQTAPHLDSPSSLYLYLKNLPEIFGSFYPNPS